MSYAPWFRCCPIELVELAQDFTAEGQHCQVPGALDGACQLPLMSGASAGLSPGANFSFLGYKPAQHFNLFVVNTGVFICTKLAFSRSRIKPAIAA